MRDFGPRYAPTLSSPSQLLIHAVIRAPRRGTLSIAPIARPCKLELEAILKHADNYDGLGWSVFGDEPVLDLPMQSSMAEGHRGSVRTNAPVTGDEFNFSCEF